MHARIILADEDHSFLRSLRRALQGDFEIVAAVPDGDTLLQLTRDLAPDVILLGLALGVCGGFDVTRRIREAIRGVKVVILSMHTDRAYVEEALNVGASGFLLKSAERAELVKAIHHVMQGGTYVGEGLPCLGTSDLRPLP